MRGMLIANLAEMRWTLGLLVFELLTGCQGTFAMTGEGPCERKLMGGNISDAPGTFSKKYKNEHLLIIDKAKSDRTLIFLPGGPGLSFDYLPEHFSELGNRFKLVYYNPGYSQNFENVTLN